MRASFLGPCQILVLKFLIIIIVFILEIRNFTRISQKTHYDVISKAKVWYSIGLTGPEPVPVVKVYVTSRIFILFLIVFC